MIDAQSALRLHLLEASELRTLLGGPYVYWPELPAGTSGAGKRVVFRFDGGASEPTLPIHRYSIHFNCYGASAYEAYQVYRELHDRLVRTGPFIVTDTFANPDEHVAFYNMSEGSPGRPLQDPGTGWHFVYSPWTATVATTPVPAPTFPS